MLSSTSAFWSSASWSCRSYLSYLSALMVSMSLSVVCECCDFNIFSASLRCCYFCASCSVSCASCSVSCVILALSLLFSSSNLFFPSCSCAILSFLLLFSSFSVCTSFLSVYFYLIS